MGVVALATVTARFAALGLIWNALAPSYDFFMYYFTLFITPMTLIASAFQLPRYILPRIHCACTTAPAITTSIESTRKFAINVKS